MLKALAFLAMRYYLQQALGAGVLEALTGLANEAFTWVDDDGRPLPGEERKRRVKAKLLDLAKAGQIATRSTAGFLLNLAVETIVAPRLLDKGGD